MNLTALEIGLILVEGSILVSFLVLILFVRRRINPALVRKMRKGPLKSSTTSWDWNRLQRLLRETESISQNLSRNLEEKKEIARRLLEGLDSRLERLQKGINSSPQGKGPVIEEMEGPDPVLRMAAAGLGVADMSRRLGRSREEIQLILDLQKWTPEPSKG